ncbi:hypothetical protein QTO34_008047 [Cnephaeus nilssonii]|uniref:Uncharacterized protein n=1 Tax=Cnephaeus nilssonii TaxID=3371016 RepID=A0AA40LTT0_CNENI|nr:hypothetical protein QTO34_008047 [Eptesicus nilssonii]
MSKLLRKLITLDLCQRPTWKIYGRLPGQHWPVMGTEACIDHPGHQSFSNPGGSGIRAEGQRPWDSTTHLDEDNHSPSKRASQDDHFPSRMKMRMTIHPAGVEARNSIPSAKSRTATPSPALQRDPGGSSPPTAAAPAVVVEPQSEPPMKTAFKLGSKMVGPQPLPPATARASRGAANVSSSACGRLSGRVSSEMATRVSADTVS